MNTSSRLIFFLFLPILWVEVENYSFLFNKFSNPTGFSFCSLLAGEVVNHVTILESLSVRRYQVVFGMVKTFS